MLCAGQKAGTRALPANLRGQTWASAQLRCRSLLCCLAAHESFHATCYSPCTDTQSSSATQSDHAGTRYAMHTSAVGRRQSVETRMKISRRMKEIHAQRKAAKRWADPACTSSASGASATAGGQSGSRPSSATFPARAHTAQPCADVMQERAALRRQCTRTSVHRGDPAAD